MSEHEQEQPKFELVKSAEALNAITAAEVNQQVATAKAYPRSVAKFLKSATELVQQSREVAEKCFYALERTNEDGTKKFIVGQSIRFAEIVATGWQHLRRGSRIIAVEEKFVVAQGVCYDAENNTSASVEVRRRITNRHGKRYSDDMIILTCNAACAIAERNAVFKIVPMALLTPVVNAARQTARGDVKTLPARRQAAMERFAEFKLTPAQVCEYVGVKGVEDIGLDELEILIGLFNRLEDKEVSVADILLELEQKRIGSAHDGGVGVGLKTPPARQNTPQPPTPAAKTPPQATGKQESASGNPPKNPESTPTPPEATPEGEGDITVSAEAALQAIRISWGKLNDEEKRSICDGLVKLPKKGAPAVADVEVLASDETKLGELLSRLPESYIKEGIAAAESADEELEGEELATALEVAWNEATPDERITVKSMVGAADALLASFVSLIEDDQRTALAEFNTLVKKRKPSTARSQSK